MANSNLNKAKEAKKDEFYAQLEDINNELRHYREHFRGKIVLCNCNDPRVSNFFTYFAYNFEFLGLKKLITTCYKNQTWTCSAGTRVNRRSIWFTRETRTATENCQMLCRDCNREKGSK